MLVGILLIGTPITSGAQLAFEDTVLQAHWHSNSSIAVAEVNNKKYTSLAQAISQVAKDNIPTTITLLHNTEENVQIDTNQNIILNLQNYIVNSSDNSKSVINNNGTLTITGASQVTSSSTSKSTITNSGTLNINRSAKIVSNTHTAIYNDGTLNINDNTEISSSSSAEKPTIYNSNNKTITITGGTVLSENYQAIYSNGTIIVGTKDGNVNSTTPVIQGATTGIYIANNITSRFYDGIIKGDTPITGEGRITEVESNYGIKHGTEGNRQTAYLAPPSEMIAEVNGLYFDTLQAAINKVPKDSTSTTIVTLLDNTEENVTIAQNQDITLNSSQKIISSTKNSAAVITNNGILTITDGKITSTVHRAISNNGTLNISGTAEINSSSTGQPTIYNNGNQTITITGGKITSNAHRAITSDGSLTISGTAKISSNATGQPTIHNGNDKTLTITGGEITSKSHKAINNDGTLTISGAAEISSSATGQATIYNNKNRIITITGGKITSSTYKAIENEGTLNISETANLLSKAPLDNATIENKAAGTLNIGGGTITKDKDNGTGPVINNLGNATMTAGTINSNAKAGAVNNKVGATFEINGGTIKATGIRQAIWNDGGTVTISGNDTYLEASAEAPNEGNMRGTVQNQASGTMIITGGKIVSKRTNEGVAVYNASGTVTIGTDDGTIQTTAPIILGEKYGVRNKATTYFYDGKLGGKSSTSGSASRNGTLLTPNNTTIKEDTTEQIDGVTYKTAYLISN